MTGTMMNHGACNGAPSTVDKSSSASSITHHAPSLNGKPPATRRSLIEERRIGNVLLRITHCDSGHCKEFTVVSITFKYYPCLIGTLALLSIGYYLQLHLRVSITCHTAQPQVVFTCTGSFSSSGIDTCLELITPSSMYKMCIIKNTF